MTKTGTVIHPVRTEQEHRAAVARIEHLMGAAPGSAEGDELDILATLVDVYETKHHAIDAPDPTAAIRFRMDQQRFTRKDLEPLIGSRARVSEVLTGKRPLTLAMIRRLHEGMGISADLLIASHRTAGIRTEKTARTRISPGEDQSRKASSSASRRARKVSAGILSGR